MMDPNARTSYLVRRLQLHLGALMERELKKEGITNGQFAVLTTIGRRSGSSSAEIARRLRVKPQALNEFIPLLENRGFIERRDHPENRRILQVFLTPEGQAVLKRCDELVDAMEAEIYSCLDVAELAAFRATLVKLIETTWRQEGRCEDGEEAGSCSGQRA
jgi:DNA-binding MarR family transcriptional regulator